MTITIQQALAQCKPEIIGAAMDEDGHIYGYVEEPDACGCAWVCNWREPIYGLSALDIEPWVNDWRESWVERKIPEPYECRTPEEFLRYYKGKKVTCDWWQRDVAWPLYFVAKNIEDGELWGETVAKPTKSNGGIDNYVLAFFKSL